jgi:6-phosphofructokinase 1
MKRSKNQRVRLALSTGGGDCPGLNAVIRAVVRHAVGTHGMEVLGIRDGLTGLLAEPNVLVPLSLEAVAGIHETGGTILGTSNKGSPFRRADGAAALAQLEAAWRRHALDALVVVGGDGTQLMAKALDAAGLAVVGVPKTIDNDLCGTDLTVGFATAVEVAAEAASRLRTSADAHDRAMILEVMGRDAGHIALATALASGANAAVLPEIPYDEGELIARCRARSAAGRSAFLVVAAEGAFPRGGQPSYLESASGGRLLGGSGARLARLLAEGAGVEARVAVLGHVQRGGPGNAADRILAARFGARAVDLVAAGKTGRIVAIKDGALVDFPYKRVVDRRRLVTVDGDEVRAAEATGISLGRKNAYQGPF